jgi:hypothetical protein
MSKLREKILEFEETGFAFESDKLKLDEVAGYKKLLSRIGKSEEEKDQLRSDYNTLIKEYEDCQTLLLQKQEQFIQLEQDFIQLLDTTTQQQQNQPIPSTTLLYASLFLKKRFILYIYKIHVGREKENAELKSCLQEIKMKYDDLLNKNEQFHLVLQTQEANVLNK